MVKFGYLHDYLKTEPAKVKIKKTMDEWKSGELHSGSKEGPIVTDQKQAEAIAINQAKRAKRG